MANALTKAKEDLFKSFRDLLVRDDCRIIYDIFHFCRLCANSNLPVADQFINEEKRELAGNCRKDLSALKNAIKTAHCQLNPSLVHNLKKVRSGIQFIADDFSFLDEFDEKNEPPLSELLKDILKWDRVAFIDEHISNWEQGGGEFYIRPDKIDLTNVPKSHTWWNDDNRQGIF
jgi:hypothetical protein